LDEFEFHLLLADGRRRVSLGRLAADAAENESGHVQSYFASLAGTWQSSEASGLLYGSIDAFLRFGNRYFVVDYKTNALHPRERGARIADYSMGRMSEEMGRHGYYLQALIYTVAAHRYLKTRLRGYDPAVNLGGAGYLFVRAMVGPGTPVVNGVRCGVHSWRPSLATIEAVDQLLDGDMP
jgi:exodeoxyribonuclease V beta subunit